MSRRYTILAITALALFGCVREEQAEEPALKTFDCFTVSVEETEMTKAHMEEGGAVKWDVGECIGVFSDTQAPVPFYRREDGKFYGEAVTGTKFYAYYPYNDPNSQINYNSSNPTTLRQEFWMFGYCSDSRSSVLMVANGVDNQLKFKQLFGLLHFKIESEYEIASIQLISNSNELFNGRGSINLLDESPIYVLDAGNGASIEDSSWEKNGAYSSMWASLYNYGKSIDAYFPIPPMSFKQGFTVQVFFRESIPGYGSYIEKKTTKTVEIKRGVMKSYSMKIEAPAEISVSPRNCVFPTEGGQKAIKVVCNGDWTVTGLPEWCGLSAISGTGDTELALTVSANEGEERRGRLCFTCREGTAYLDLLQIPVNGWQYQKFVHKSLCMMFTSVYCGWSQVMNNNINAANDLVGDKYCRVDVHGRGLGDAMAASPLDFPEARRLEGLYYYATPSGIIDFRRRLENWTDENAYKIREILASSIQEQEDAYPAATGLAFATTLSEGILNVSGKVYSHCAETFRLSVYLIEDKVEQEYDNVLRISLSDTLGDEIIFDMKNSSRDFCYRITIPEEYLPENLSVLVIVQRQFGAQTILRDAYYGEYYVDNCRRIKVGEEINLELFDYLLDDGNEGIDIDDEISL